jgi:tRNA(Ile2) C34 agmatinyltransferase TiaS
MPCPSCSGTMQNVGVPDSRVFWCPRCGTLRMVDSDDVESDHPPSLVERCRQMEAHLETTGIANAWVRLGISEAIYAKRQ